MMMNACDQSSGRSSRPLTGGQPAGPDGCRIPALSCDFCGADLPVPVRRARLPRRFCDARCRSRFHQAERQRAIQHVADLVRSFATLLYHTHAAMATVCTNLETLSLPRRRHIHADEVAFPAILTADLEHARDAISRVLAELSPQVGPRLCPAEVPAPDEEGAGESPGDLGGPCAMAGPLGRPQHGALLHPPRLHMAESTPVGGRPLAGTGAPAGAPDGSERDQRTGVGE